MQFHIHSFADEAGAGLSAQIAAMKRNGHEGLEIRNLGGRNVTELSEKEAAEVAKALADEGLRVWSVGSPIGKIGIHDDFPAHLELFRHTLELAAIFGAEAFRLFSFYIPKGEDPALYREEVIERLGRLCDLGRPYGIALCHENEKGIYGDLAPRCLELHRALPGLSAVFDPANFIQCGQETLSAWELLAPYVKYLHIKDALENGVVVPAGAGLGHVAEIVRAYAAQGGRDLTLEPHLNQLTGTGMQIEKELLGLSYPDADAAFDAACAALAGITEAI